MSGAVVTHWISNFLTADKNAINPDGHTTLDLNLNYQITPTLTVGGQILNLLDADYYLPLSDQAHLPMPGLTVLLSIELHNL